MSNLDDAVNALLPVVNDLQPRMRSWLATAGDGRGNVIDTSVPNHVFVRVLNNAVGTAPAVQTISVFNDISLLADGDRCVIGFGPERPRLLRVLAKQDQRYDTTTDGSIIIGGSNQGVLPHGWQHAWLAPDPVFLDFFQIINLAVYPAGGLSVAIQRGIIPRIGVDTLVDNQTLDLTSYQPVSGALWALLSVAIDSTITVTLSANVGSRLSLDYTAIPDTPAGNFRLAAVALYEAQTEIILSKTQQDIFDLRWPQETGAGSGGGSSATTVFFLNKSTTALPLLILPGFPTFTLGVLPDGLTQQDVTVASSTTADFVVAFITTSPLGIAFLTGGIVNLTVHALLDSGTSNLFFKLFTSIPDGLGGVTTTLQATSNYSANLTASDAAYTLLAVLSDTIIDPNSSLYVEIYAHTTSGTPNVTVSFDGSTNARITLPAAGTGGAGSIPLADGHILVGNSSSIATDVAMSEAATIDDTGAVEITAHTIIEMQVFGG